MADYIHGEQERDRQFLITKINSETQRSMAIKTEKSQLMEARKRMRQEAELQKH